MNRLMLAVSTLLLAGAAQATPDPGALVLAQNLPGNNDPYSNPIRRANPNSMQGTQPNVPTIRHNPTIPAPRPPTLENGGIGNGYPRSGPPPGSPRPTIESGTPNRNMNNGNRQ
ncbi:MULTISPECIES: hypothetical protein [Pseudomonas]|uniref:hypothetical protein n=1 Tax=Pseudomonas TaxID=286 RepID=UPI0009089C5A|nr:MULTISPECIES: hypothetical protein [Pseudomonas]NHN68519.1 hypothetical protein [Pseudomonas fluorescens]ROO40233.1 hypothetical protein BIV08_01285 [Pseudomonas sp. AF76]SFW44632.1 hypothetical protein SAMN03159376_01559 [Pseudomonas sp. NFACC09-4]SFX56562.1 hypothetical protein SAMN03159442_02116 [Pseudomonas sp. NFACC47-1]SFX83793.1 hypothetical protein SAMN03159352_02322 [Pseudomonas sp. NFACC43]